MSLPMQINVWDLWSESVRQAESAGDPVFLECLEAASNSRMFDDLPDEKLKTSLSIMNSLLNDPKTKQKGLAVFNEFATQINPSRLIGFQEAVISSLHLVVKRLELQSANSALVNFLPKCNGMTEVNQIVTSSIVPKILSNFVEDAKESTFQKSHEEIALLKVCLQNYHGPCGNFRDKLEKIFMPMIDSDNKELIQTMSEILPLISYAGGGGNAGEKHIKDWNTMLTKCLNTSYSTFLQMYSECSPLLDLNNLLDGEQLSGLKKIAGSQVLLRLSLLKRRLENLVTIILGYLRFPFPAPKLVPLKGLIKFITCLTSVPLSAAKISNSKSQTKENIYLEAMGPGVHSIALSLMRSLFDCVGSNVFTEGAAIEHIICCELKWLQEKHTSFEKLRLELYETLAAWLDLTCGNVTNFKSLTLWINAIGVDTRVEKDVVELKVLSKQKPGKSVKLVNSSSLNLSSGGIMQTFVRKSPALCQLALNTLMRIIPALDVDNHKKIYEHLLKTVSIICQFQCPPSPYNNPECRKLAYKNLAILCYNPNPRSPVSIALIVTLLRQGMQDPTSLVSTFCSNQVSQIERLIHPVSTPLMLVGSTPHPVVVLNSYENNLSVGNEDPDVETSSDDQLIEHTKSSQSTVSNTRSPAKANLNKWNEERLLVLLKEKMEETLKDLFTISSAVQADNEQNNITGTRNSSSSRNNVYQVNCVDVEGEEAHRDDNFSDECQLNDDNAVLDETHSEMLVLNGDCEQNGNDYDSDLEILEENVSLVEGCQDKKKRKIGEDEVIVEEVVKRKKDASPCKLSSLTVEVSDEISVDEMLATFIDVEPVP